MEIMQRKAHVNRVHRNSPFNMKRLNDQRFSEGEGDGAGMSILKKLMIKISTEFLSD